MDIDIPPQKPNFFQREIKPLIWPFVFLFAVFFFVVNWDNVIWIFNKEALKQAILDRTTELTLQPEPILPATPTTSVPVGAHFAPEELANAKVIIPKIELEKPLTFPVNTDKQTIDEALMGKIMHYPGTALPGNLGATTLLAHSAPITWGPSYRVFNKIDQLTAGDDIIVYVGEQSFVYQVKRHFLINPGDQLPVDTTKKTAYLLTCWPPNTGKQRMVVEAEIGNN